MIEVVQIVTVVVLMLGLFWQQQRVFDGLGIRMDARFDKIDKRFDKLETKLDARFDKIDKRFDKLDECLRACAGRRSLGAPAVSPVDEFGGEKQRDREGELGESVSWPAVGVAA